MKFLTHDGLLYFWQQVKSYVDTANATKANTSHTHTKSQITDFPTIPTTLPANGGNADTVDGYHISKKTQDEYDSLETKDDSTIYIIVDEE